MTTVPSEDDWEAQLAEATRPGSNVTPGVVFIAVDKHGETIYNKAAGRTSVLPDAPAMPTDAIMWIASCTKLITAIAALQCVERGQITLDEPLGVSHLLPELADPQVISLDSGSSSDGYKLRPARGDITLRRLLTHTSGNSYEWGDERLAAWRKCNPIEAGKEGMMPYLFRTPLLFDPGEGWVYGGGLDWVGVLVARLNSTTGTLGDYFDTHIFKPLDMSSTTFHLDKRPDLRARVIPTTDRSADGSLRAREANDLVYHETVPDESGGGGLWSCATDYIKIIADLVRDEPLLLKRSTVTHMLAAPQLQPGSPALANLSDTRRPTAVASNAAASTSAAEPGYNYGLGGLLITSPTPYLPTGSLSWGGLPNLKWFLHPELQVGAVMFQQIMPPGDVPAGELAGRFFKEVVRMHGTG